MAAFVVIRETHNQDGTLRAALPLSVFTGREGFANAKSFAEECMANIMATGGTNRVDCHGMGSFVVTCHIPGGKMITYTVTQVAHSRDRSKG